ncbi:MAG: DEAD/DEAH box helicase family protein, partial [Rikenellaceae bacterium]
MDFKLVSSYQPTGDQPEAIKTIVDTLRSDHNHVTLWGVTGSGKTFTMANVIKEMGKPVLVLSHNKTLAAQLYSEFKAFFPENAVEYFVSYYDYFQPEAYIPASDTYIEKDLSINEDLEKLRLSTTSTLLSGRKDIIVVSSVSCIYGIGNPDDFAANTIELKVGQRVSRNKLLLDLTSSLFNRSGGEEFKRGQFRVKGDTIDIYAAYGDVVFRISLIDNMIEELSVIDPLTGIRLEPRDAITIHPANIFVTTKERIASAIRQIEDDLTTRIAEFKAMGKEEEAARIKHRVEYDLEMIREIGYCQGIENYSRYFDGRAPGSRPFCLLDYFPKDFITFVDESHVTIPQIKGMFAGDESRKRNLVDYAWRLPAALDNRPLKLPEFESMIGKTVYVSATPVEYEIAKSEGVYAEQS